MRTIASLAATAILLCTPLGFVLAQTAPDPGAPAAPATTAAPAAPAAPAEPAAQTPPANAPAPATQSANPPPTNAPSANPPTTTTDNAHKAKKKTAGMTRRREIEKSIDSGTVPSRYRSSVPKEYQQYIPFSKY